MKTIQDLIREHAFFQGLPDDLTAFIAGCGRNVLFEPGAYLFREGHPAEQFFLLRGGRVALELYVPGRGPQVFETLGDGDVVGASWLVEPYVSSYDTRAIDRVRAIAFDAVCLRGKCDAEPTVGYALMKRFVPGLVQRMQAARLQALDVYGKSA